MAPTPTAPANAETPCRVLGLRERKKQRTRDALVDAAHSLFLSQGYARTTIDEIAAAVDVSQRTFFRYFANKDEAALAVLADAEDYFIECLRRRPAAENPLQAMRAAITESWRGLGSEHTGGVRAALELLQLIESTPTLLAAHLRRTTEQEGVVAQVLADREGLDAATDLRPRLLAAVFGAVLRVSHLAWGSGPFPDQDAGPEGMIAIIERHFDQLGPALVGDWR
ncbi:AcrR family transcriptional regulator [Kitasatospora sp. MAA4]|uniref:TetR/AcrR family transcriptional regulator n=1 Tax=Kitasatospora sp. MAA4 TaxID=3035093 RepID=UPI0024754C24|nr:TetR family transcriptional regulator [Kitasatospora sp. MAA4]MDH6131784.1 AcrR family transcriptional regulator [Kitasatospora sp. MAA4]